MPYRRFRLHGGAINVGLQVTVLGTGLGRSDFTGRMLPPAGAVRNIQMGVLLALMLRLTLALSFTTQIYSFSQMHQTKFSSPSLRMMQPCMLIRKCNLEVFGIGHSKVPTNLKWRARFLPVLKSRKISLKAEGDVRKISDHINFFIERLLSRGASTQFVVFVALSTLIVIFGAVLIWIACFGSSTLEYSLSKSYLLLFR